MSDCEDITHFRKKTSMHKKSHKADRDDLGGMIVNMGRHIDVREMFIIWIMFIFIHTEMFAEHFLKKISGTVNDDCSMTMKGTFVSSVMMIVVVMVCAMTF